MLQKLMYSGLCELFVSISLFLPVVRIGMYQDFVCSLSVDMVVRLGIKSCAENHQINGHDFLKSKLKW